MKEDYPYQRIFKRDNFTCQYCGWSGDNFEKWYIASLCIDHVKPQSKGGTDDDSNLVVSCHACNLYKGGIPCESFAEAKEVVTQKHAQARSWFEKHVLKNKIAEIQAL